MPYINEWREPEHFLIHNGVNIYHTYVDDDIDQGTLDFWFTTNPDDDDTGKFDVRDLATWKHDGGIVEALKLAIDRGLLVNDEDPIDEQSDL